MITAPTVCFMIISLFYLQSYRFYTKLVPLALQPIPPPLTVFIHSHTHTYSHIMHTVCYIRLINNENVDLQLLITKGNGKECILKRSIKMYACFFQSHSECIVQHKERAYVSKLCLKVFFKHLCGGRGMVEWQPWMKGRQAEPVGFSTLLIHCWSWGKLELIITDSVGENRSTQSKPTQSQGKTLQRKAPINSRLQTQNLLAVS